METDTVSSVAFSPVTGVFSAADVPILVCGTMITADALTSYIKQAMSDATVSVTDRTGTMDHLQINIVSDHFKGKNLLDRHRMVYQALDAPMKDGRIHALEISAQARDET